MHPARMPRPETEAPKILLLDVRPIQDYLKWHIDNAVSFPAANIQKDHVFGQLGTVRNKADKLLVVYSYDERHGTQVAKQIFEKGFDNVYLLTGGISVFGYENQDLLDGEAVPLRKELKNWHDVATAQQPKKVNQQSSKGFTSHMDLQR